ncbi:hypothetical protein GLOIN_2v1632452 [Rhizophagus clarus]|uniref:Uncharacterized protein n=1 Tax=Rhizophagus clarus TaxID=94130 RepID=A0A8H3LJM8_9GLOM|nr:hypothetical protein GLOIN_2v1632452 [Rhizophagus clarus]
MTEQSSLSEFLNASALYYQGYRASDIDASLYKIRDDSVKPRHFLGADNADEIEAILTEHEGHSLHEIIDDTCLEIFPEWDKETMSIAKSSEEKKISLHVLTFAVAFLNEKYKKKVSEEIRQRNREKKLQQKNEQAEIDEERAVLPDIINLYKTARSAEKKAIEANREETLRWCSYAREFKRMYKDFMVNNKVGEKKAKDQVYDFIIKQLSDTKRKTLCRQTQKALRIDDLFEKIGMDKLQYIKTYSADTISKFTDPQIQTIIDHFTEKPNMEFIDDTEDVEQDDEVPEGSDQNNALEVLSLAKLTSTAPIPLAHISNSSDDTSSSKKLDTKVEVVPPIPQSNNPTHVQARNKVLKLYPDISFHSKPFDESEDVYRCRTKSSICPSCKTNHKENIVGRYWEGSYLLSCMYKMKGLEPWSLPCPICGKHVYFLRHDQKIDYQSTPKACQSCYSMTRFINMVTWSQEDPYSWLSSLEEKWQKVNCEIHRTLQNEPNNHTSWPGGNNNNLAQISSDIGYHFLGCLSSSLELRFSTFKEDEFRDANRLFDEKSGTPSGKYENNSARSIGSTRSTGSKIASINREYNVFERDFKMKRNGCEIHDGCIDSLSYENEETGNKAENGEYADVKVGIGCEGCPNRRTITELQSRFGELLRIGSLGGDAWKPTTPSKTCHPVHTHSRYTEEGSSIIKHQGSVSQVPVRERTEGTASRRSDTSILVDKFEDISRIATLFKFKILDVDPKELTYYIKYCCGRVFLWDDENLLLWPLGDSPEEASKYTIKGKDRLGWFVENGIVYEYIKKPQFKK